jgi:hypothetical protein
MNDSQLAWKNLWRNKRRTIITAASVFFAVFFTLVMRSFQLGTYDALFRNVIESYTGYLQLQHKDYFDESVIDNGFELDQSLLLNISSDPNVKTVVPRLESFALAAAESRTQGVMVLGIDPEGEDKVTDLRKKLVKYKLSPEAILALKESAIPLRTKKLLDVFANESYSSVGRLMLYFQFYAGTLHSKTDIFLPKKPVMRLLETDYLIILKRELEIPWYCLDRVIMAPRLPANMQLKV